jgi:hypothetical protein
LIFFFVKVNYTKLSQIDYFSWLGKLYKVIFRLITFLGKVNYTISNATVFVTYEISNNTQKF